MSTISHRLKHLADTIETLENNGTTVSEISMDSNGDESSAGLAAAFSITIPLPLQCTGESESALSATEAEITEDGSITVTFEGEIIDQELETISIQYESGQDSSKSKENLPPHRNPDALQAAYEKCNTFVEMKQALGTEVTPEAVRQQMVKHGIHEVPEERPPEGETDSDSRESENTSPPSDNVSKDTQQIDSPKEVEFISDGGFPAELTVSSLKDIVQSSQTLYEATQQLDVDQEEARDLLKQLNLLDLVTGRLSTRDERHVTEEEIDRRIHSSGLVQP